MPSISTNESSKNDSNLFEKTANFGNLLPKKL